MIDVDGHNFPNLALMRISAYHKARGDEVEWWWTDFVHYDVVYMSKIFSDAHRKDRTMTTFIKLHTDIDKLVFINPAHIVKIEEQGYPPRTLISTVDDSMTAVTEYPYQVLDRIWKEERE